MNTTVLDAKPHSRKKLLISAAALILALAAAIGAGVYINSRAYKSCRVEAGVEVLASDFMKNADPSACFTEASQAFDIHVPGEYRVTVKSGLFRYQSTLYIEDTVPPSAQPAPLVLALGETCAPEDLLSEITDATAVTAAFSLPPDFSAIGVQKVDIILTDLVGNSSSVSSELSISPFVSSLAWEAGDEAPTADDFALTDVSAQFVTNIGSLDLHHVADYELILSSGGIRYPSVLHVVDTAAPTGEVTDLSTCTFAPLTADRFVVSTEDATDVTASFQTEPDMTRVGQQTVSLVLTDEGGNETVLTAVLHLEEDTTPPVILGARDIELLQGESIAYRRNVALEDDFPEEISLSIDSSGVDRETPGVYKARYIAEDVSGNRSEAVITVTVHPWSVSEEELNRLADEVLERIFVDGMTGLEKVTAIYDYIFSSVRYADHSEKGDWARAAYEGLSDHQGDCYVYACTSKLLLTRAGITNMDISKSTISGDHYWNLVDLGDGWYHFDTTPRMIPARIIMWTDEELRYFSAACDNSHDYDRSLYPNIN